MTLNQFTSKIFKAQSPFERFPIGAAFERDVQDGRTVAYEIIGFMPHDETTLTVAVEYQYWNKVWGWMGNGHYERLEVVYNQGEYNLVSYTNWTGITEKELS